MGIKIVWEDVGAPGLVIAADLITARYAPEYNDIANYVMTGAGYLAAGLGFGGKMQDFLLKVGIASLPLTARALKAKFATPGVPQESRVGATRFALSRSVRSYPAQPQNAQQWPTAV